MVSFQRWAGSADEDINLFWWAAKTIAGSYMRVMMGKLMLWALKLDPSLHLLGYQMKTHVKGF
jgi:hypothetical protein